MGDNLPSICMKWLYIDKSLSISFTNQMKTVMNLKEFIFVMNVEVWMEV